jgi:hypothetical protein
MRELAVDLTQMGWEGLLPKPWNVRNEAMQRDYLFEQWNQWRRTMKRDSEQWTAEVWVDVYSFALRKREGWASQNVTHFVRIFKIEKNPKNGFYLVDSRNPRERRVIEFLL